MKVALFLASFATAFYQPPPGKVWLSAWLDTADSSPGAMDGDRPVKFNQRLGMNISSFQYGQNLPINYTNKEFPFPMEQIDATSTDAVVYLTVYPFRSTLPYWDVSDADIAFLAEQIKNLTTRPYNPAKVLLRLAPEMNGNWMTYGMQPTKFIPLWRRVHSAVKQAAPETAFVWSPNFGPGYPFGSQNGRSFIGPIDSEDLAALDTNRNGRFDSGDDPYSPYYPGDEYVDWVGLSFYWKGMNTIPGPGQYESYINDGNFYQDYAVRKNKPIMVAEGGAVLFPNSPIPPGVTELQIKQEWWRQSITSPEFLDKYSQVKLISLFEFQKIEDHSPFSGPAPLSDFRITNKTDMVEAFVRDFERVASRYEMAPYLPPPTPPPPPPTTSTDSGSSPKPTKSSNSIKNGLCTLLVFSSVALLLA